MTDAANCTRCGCELGPGKGCEIIIGRVVTSECDDCGDVHPALANDGTVTIGKVTLHLDDDDE